MKVKECMCSEVVCVKPEETVVDVAKKMQENHVGCIPVCDDTNKILGLVTDRDLILRCIACDKDYKTMPVKDIMTTDLYTVEPEDEVKRATEYMCECQVKRVPVIENGSIKGILTVADISTNPEISTFHVGETMEGICGCHRNKNAE